MKSIKLDFVRSGGETGVLQQGQQYLVVIESLQHRQFSMPLSQAEFLRALAGLRYHPLLTKTQRDEALAKLAQLVTEILMTKVPAYPEMVQLDLVTTARELWALPFEAALAPDGQPLFVRRDPAVVLTRRIPQGFAEQPSNWPARPRILFAYATPNWAGPAVPAGAHQDALLKALQPWVEPLRDLDMLVGQETSVLTTLPEASLENIAQACREAEAARRPYTHIHLLAHGIKITDAVYDFETCYGVALHAADNKGITPKALVEAIRPATTPDGPPRQLPVAVTLAICDGGNAANSIIEAGGIAQELHQAGVPIVIASQLPLTFPGSVVMTSAFYEGWMRGQDVRQVLHNTRVALHEAKEAEHDWVSLVAYVRLPEGYGEYIRTVHLESQLAALETASNYAQQLLDKAITSEFAYNQVDDRMQERIRQLEALLAQYDKSGEKPRAEVVQENAGLIGSAYKRLAELYHRRARVDSARAAHWQGESRKALEKARTVYHSGFRRNTSHHWSGVQYLSLHVVLSGEVSGVKEWYASYQAAEAQLSLAGSSEKDRIWAQGSIAELVLLAPFIKGVPLDPAAGEAALNWLRDRVKAAPAEYPYPSPVDVTRRQLLRYADWWTNANGYCGAGPGDLAGEARRLVQLLDAQPAVADPSPGHFQG